jgi:Type II CAAX prenyl endopeptidase Rce1-like
MRRRPLILAIPALVPTSMALLFDLLRRRLSPRAAYNVGFAAYWAGWCFAAPVWLLGAAGARRALARGHRPDRTEVALLLLPVTGAVATELLPKRRSVSPAVATVMVASAAVNAVGEELLWRGLFVEEYPEDVIRGCLWPLAGFTLWHLAPQLILPSSKGRRQFVAGSAVVGGAFATVTWRHKGIRSVLLPHALTDACGVSAARFRVGR